MHYVANAQLKVARRVHDKDEVIIYKPGDVIPDFEKWDTVAQRSHLNLDWVRKESGPPPEPPAPPKPAKAAKDTPKKDELPPAASAPDTKKVEAQAVSFDCPKCPKKNFKSAKALKTHAALAHK